MKRTPLPPRYKIDASDLSNTPKVPEEETTIYSFLKNHGKPLYHTDKEVDAAQVIVWEKQAISFDDEQAMNALKADLNKKEPGVFKGVALRVITEGDNGMEHVSMTAPETFLNEEGLAGKIENYAERHLDYIKKDPELFDKVKNGATLEIIPLRSYRVSRYTVEFPKEKLFGIDLKKYIGKLADYVAPAEIGNADPDRGMVTLTGKLDMELFDSANPVIPYPRMRGENAGKTPLTPRYKFSFGKLGGNGRPCHVSARVLGSNGQIVKLSEDLSMSKLMEKDAGLTQEKPSSKINPENFSAQVDNLFDRIEALERREKLNR